MAIIKRTSSTKSKVVKAKPTTKKKVDEIPVAAPANPTPVGELTKFKSLITNISKTMLSGKPGFNRQLAKTIGEDSIKVILNSTEAGIKIEYIVNGKDKLNKEFKDPDKIVSAFAKL